MSDSAQQAATPIRANIITGFLGVGKTTAIRTLLAHKTADERWAVLVNEFGEVGLDGTLIEAGQGEDIIVEEVPGGCLCCAAGLPFQVALRRILARIKPQRLLIEPTGLGHAGDILGILASYQSAGQLALDATLTLVDARKVEYDRYREHPVFLQQLRVADIIVAHKADCCSDADFAALEAFLSAQHIQTPVVAASFGQIDPALLHRASGAVFSVSAAMPMLLDTGYSAEQPYNEQGYCRLENSAEGFFSVGWLFSPEWEFDHTTVLALFTGQSVERLKAVVITQQGIIAANLADGVLSLSELDECEQTRIEMISREPPEAEAIEQMLLASAKRLGG
ncbi:MAG TPA: GTP-binding protein [Cellvibrionaceae bacterium]